ncbi:hypothetical protein GWK47_053164 [Chionoecetes opilio]|uniref:Ubiquitin-like domain-containing protein n=1 Tax=Chionoecetes opilio TaxID=41210 RepID=A0A8J4Y0Y3_CHIOP|nr:hypothetical protein GWK47_053164 [Chionoecetes opilio]
MSQPLPRHFPRGNSFFLHVAATMQLFVRAASTHVLEASEGMCVRDVRALVCAAEDLPEAEVRLYTAGSPLDNDAVLLSTLSTAAIDVSLALKGGKRLSKGTAL